MKLVLNLPSEFQEYCYDITEHSTCLSNVPEESRSNVRGIRACRRIFERFIEGASRADCVKAAVNYIFTLALRRN